MKNLPSNAEAIEIIKSAGFNLAGFEANGPFKYRDIDYHLKLEIDNNYFYTTISILEGVDFDIVAKIENKIKDFKYTVENFDEDFIDPFDELIAEQLCNRIDFENKSHNHFNVKIVNEFCRKILRAYKSPKDFLNAYDNMDISAIKNRADKSARRIEKETMKVVEELKKAKEKELKA